MTVPNWVVVIPQLTLAIVTLLWGVDLLVTEYTYRPYRAWWRLPLRSGSWWMGVFLLSADMVLHGTLGFVFLAHPNAPVPLWYALTSGIGAAAAVMAWLLLSRESRIVRETARESRETAAEQSAKESARESAESADRSETSATASAESATKSAKSAAESAREGAQSAKEGAESAREGAVSAREGAESAKEGAESADRSERAGEQEKRS